MRTRFGISLLLLFAAQMRPSEKRFSLRGQVVDGLSERPINDVELTLATANWESAGEAVWPDPQGRFVFSGLAAGQYVLSAVRPGFGTVFFGELPEPGAMQTIRVGPQDEEKITIFRLVPRSVVTGVV